MAYYSTVKNVKDYTGIRPEDLGFTTSIALDNFIEERLVEIKDLIDHDRNRNYHEEVEAGTRVNIPPGIHHIALRIMANLIGYAVVRRDTPIVRIGDFTMQMIEDKIFTPHIKKDLSVYPAKANFRMMRVSMEDDNGDINCI